MPTTNTTAFSGRHAMVRTRCPIKVQASNTIVTSGTAAQFTITILQAGQIGDTIDLFWGSEFVRFTCGTTPNAPYTYLTAPNALQTAIRFGEAAFNSYLIDRDFVVSYGGTNQVFFAAKKKGTVYQLTNMVATPDTRASFANTVTGVDPQRAPNIKVGLALYVSVDGENAPPERIGEMLAVPDDNGNCEFDVSTVLEPYVRDAEQLPYVDNSLPQAVALTSTRKQFYYRTWERYGEPVQDGPMSSIIGGINIAVYGGIQRIERQRFNNWYAGSLLVPNKFLTWRGRHTPRLVTKDEQVWLSCYNAYQRIPVGGGAYESIQLYACVHYADGVPDGPFLPKITNLYNTGIQLGQFGAWPAGWNMLNMSASGGTPVGYSIQLRGGTSNTTISEVYRFDLTDNDYNEIHLQFLNSLGCWESLRTTGGWRVLRSGEYQQLERYLSMDEVVAALVGGHSAEPLATTYALEVNTGHNPLEEHQCIMDILGSPQVRLVDLKRDRFVPLRLADANETELAKRGDVNEHLHSAQLRFLMDDPTEVYTLIPPSQLTDAGTGITG